nr:MAG: nonstructural protein [Wufeng shrew carmotetravirus 2]
MAVNTLGKLKLPQPTTEDYTQYARNTLKNLNNVYAKLAVKGPVLALVRPGTFAKLKIVTDGGLQHSELKGMKILCDPVLQRSFAAGSASAPGLIRACLQPTLELKEMDSGYVVCGRGSLLTCGDVESNPGPVSTWLRSVIPVIYRKAADASLVQSVVAKTGSELFAEASRRNGALASNLGQVANRLKSQDMCAYGKRYLKLSTRQGRISDKLSATARLAEARAHAFNHAWRRAHGSKLATARKGGLFALFGAGVVITNELTTQVSREPADNTASQVLPLVSATTYARNTAAAGHALNTIAGEPIYPAMEILFAACESHTTNPEFWGKLYVRAFKYVHVHFMSSHSLSYRKQGRGVAIGYTIPESARSVDNADLVAVLVEYVEALRNCHNVAAECGDWADTTNWKYNLTGVTCAHVSDVLAHSLFRLQVHPAFLSNRLSSVYTECAEFATTLDWTQELENLIRQHHLSALCDPAICQYSGLCATLSNVAVYKDAYEVSYLLKCITHSRSIAAVRGKIVDPTAVTACGLDGTRGGGGVQPLAGLSVSRPVSYVAAVAGCPRSDSPDLVFEASGSNLPGGVGGPGPDNKGVHSVASGPRNVLLQDSGDAQNVSGPRVSVVKEQPPQHGRESEARNISQGSGSGHDPMQGGSPVPGGSTGQSSLPVVGNQPAEVRVEQPLGVGDGAVTTNQIAIKVGGTTGNMRSSRPPGKGRGPNNRAGTNDGPVQPPSSTDANPAIPRAVLEPLGARGLCTQSAEGGEGEGVGQGAPGDGTGNSATAAGNGPRVIEFAAVNCTFELGRVYIRVPAEQEEAIRDGLVRVFIARFDPEGCNDKSLRENGKTTNPPQTRRPKTNTVKGNRVPPSVLDDDKASGARPDAHRRPGNGIANGGKGKKPGRKGPPPVEDVAHIRETGEHIIRPESVGHACSSPPTEEGPRDIQQPCDVPSSSGNVQHPTEERLLHKQGYTLPSKWRNHEWGYDDRAGELYCSTCSSYVLPGRYKKNCYHERKQHARRLGGVALKYGNPRSGVSPEVSRDKSPSSGRSVETGVAKHIRRRRRPRDHLRDQPHVDMRRSPPALVDGDGPHPSGGWNGRGVPQHRVLPTQTMEWSNSRYNGTQPGKSYAEILHGHGKIYQPTPILPPYSMDSESHFARGHPAPRPVLPEQRQAIGWGPTYGGGQPGVPAYQLVPPLFNEVPREWYVSAFPADCGRYGPGAVLANVGHFANGAE